jgi:hypothetical protein
MKKIFLVCILFLLPIPFLLSQEPACAVLIKDLQGTYEGDCKKGLAHGKGTAKGVDTYTGYFKKGFPHGKGSYTWAAGDRFEGFWKMGIKEGEGIFHTQIDGKDTIIAGIWKEDKYIGSKPAAPVVLLNYGVKNVSFSRKGDGEIITFMFMQGGSHSTAVSNVIIFGSSGTEFTSGSYQGYEKIIFPFKVRITYRTMNSFRTGMTDCVLEFRITQPGRWDVKIFN